MLSQVKGQCVQIWIGELKKGSPLRSFYTEGVASDVRAMFDNRRPYVRVQRCTQIANTLEITCLNYDLQKSLGF
jgi:hypothetical protein